MYEKIYAGNLAFEVTEEELRGLFQSAGCEVIECRIFYDDRRGLSRGFGTLRVPKGDAARALALHDSEHRGRKLLIRPWRESARFTQPRWGKRA